jgi:membrane-associated protease RseP (regulator of RpoE activity)
MTDTHRSDSAHDAGAPAPASAGEVGPAAGPEDHVPEAYTPEDGRARDVGPGWPPVAGGRGPQSPWTGDMETPTTATGMLRLAFIAVLVAAVGVRFGWTYPVIIGGIVLMIFLHELGHFVTAKRSGMKVTEFFIGFGPRIWSFRRGETEYGLKVIPAGAYVRIVGMNNLDEADPADEARTYRHQSFPKRLLVVSAGSISHMLQAFVLLVIALGLVGVPGGSLMSDQADARAWEVGQVTQDSAASEAGLRTDDEIVAVDGRSVQALDQDLSSVISGYEVGDTLELTVQRDGQERTLEATLGARPADIEGGRPGTPFLGVSSGPVFDDDPIGLGPALVQTPGEMVQFTGESLGALASFFSPNGLGDFADNVNNASADAQRNASNDPAPAREGEGNRMVSIYGVVRMGADLWEQGGVVVLLLLFFQINMFIGIFNMVPLPPLDGGHAAVAVYERIRSRRGLRYHADVTKLLPVTYAVVMGLVLLGVTSLYLDIVNPVNL